jgi:hypothetical protein
MEKTKKTVHSENKEKKSKTKTQKVPKLKKEPLTLFSVLVIFLPSKNSPNLIALTIFL